MEKIRNRHLNHLSMQPAKSFVFPRVFDLWLCSFGHDRKTAALTPSALAPETATRRKTRIQQILVCKFTLFHQARPLIAAELHAKCTETSVSTRPRPVLITVQESALWWSTNTDILEVRQI